MLSLLPSVFSEAVAITKGVQVALLCACLLALGAWRVDVSFDCPSVETDIDDSINYRLDDFNLASFDTYDCRGNIAKIYTENYAPKYTALYCLLWATLLYALVSLSLFTFARNTYFRYFASREIYVMGGAALGWFMVFFLWWSSTNGIAQQTGSERLVEVLRKDAGFWRSVKKAELRSLIDSVIVSNQQRALTLSVLLCLAVCLSHCYAFWRLFTDARNTSNAPNTVVNPRFDFTESDEPTAV